jgi:hypothetical protein
LASKPVAMIFSALASKLVAMIFFDLASKPVAMVFFDLVSKPVVMISSGLASKPVVGFLVERQNQGGGGFFGLSLITDIYGFVIWASKSPRRFLSLRLKTMQSLIWPQNRWRWFLPVWP